MAKYVDRRYVLRREEADPSRLYEAVKSRDLVSLLQLYSEGADLAKPLVLPDGQVNIQLQGGFPHQHFLLNCLLLGCMNES